MKKLAFAAVIALSATNLHAGSFGNSESFSESSIQVQTVEQSTARSSSGDNWWFLMAVALAVAALGK